MKENKIEKLKKESLEIESKIDFLTNKSKAIPFPYSRLSFLISRRSEIINKLKKNILGE